MPEGNSTSQESADGTAEPTSQEQGDPPPTDAGSEPAGDNAQENGSPEQSGQEATTEGDEEKVPGTIPGADMEEVNDEDTRPRPGEEGFIGPVAPEDRQNGSSGGSLDSIIEQLQGTKRDSDHAHSEGDRGSRDVIDSWLDPNQDPARDRTGRTLDETRAVGDSADALGQQVGRTQEQIDAARREIEKSDQDAGSAGLLQSLLGSGESDVVDQRAQELAAAERERIAHQTADQIRNDPAWDQLETAPHRNPEVLAGADILANAGAGVDGAQLAQEAARKADWWSGIAARAREYLPNSDVQRHVTLHGQVGRGESNALHFSNVSKLANVASKFGGPVLGLPLAGQAIDNDIADGESVAQAYWSNGAGWGASALTGLAIGASVGGPVGAVLGAIGGAAAGAVTSGAIDNWFEHGSLVAPQRSPQA
ncbi:hypothetical protein A4R43_12205 [Amycolatopsis albispora]|uniref:Uncharacterized protein n=1 Tax=Amycolatopsis albispora TaxID=1804986 RepID=A0A344L593_9PSEU|nr:hypothetical protein A4R43_12205 [Amycolatopsis albispora]